MRELTVKEAAKILEITANGVHNAIKRNRMKNAYNTQPGGRRGEWRIPIQDVEIYAENYLKRKIDLKIYDSIEIN